MRKYLKPFQLFEYFNLLIASLIVFGPIYYLWLNLPIKSDDYLIHLGWAEGIAKNPQNLPASVTAHAAWQWLVWLSHTIFDLSWGTAGLVVTLGSVVLTVGILYWLIRKHLSPLLSGALAIGLSIFAPLMFIDPLNNVMFMTNGYFAANIYHNPTILLLKPFALLQFVLVSDTLEKPQSDWKIIVFTAVVSALAIYSKPSYAICLLPALAVMVLFKILMKKRVDWMRLIFGIVLPTLAFLFWQYLITFGAEADSSIVFAPFKVMNHFSAYLLPKLVLSIVFPLCVTFFCWREARREKKIQLAWLGFLFSLLFTYFFAETGEREFAANFYWSSEITIFLLFVACVLFLAERRYFFENAVRKWFILVTGFLHLTFGLIYYFYNIYNLYTYTFYQFWW